MTATDPRSGALEPSDLRRWIRRILPGPVLLVAVVAVTVSLRRRGPTTGRAAGSPRGWARW